MGRLRRPSPFGPPPRSPTRSLRGPGGALPPLRPPPPARRGGVCHLPRQRAVALPDGPVHPQAVEGAELGEDVRPPVASGDRVSGCRSGCSFKGAPQAVEGNGDGRPRRGRAVRCERVVEELVQRAGGGGALMVSCQCGSPRGEGGLATWWVAAWTRKTRVLCGLRQGRRVGESATPRGRRWNGRDTTDEEISHGSVVEPINC